MRSERQILSRSGRYFNPLVIKLRRIHYLYMNFEFCWFELWAIQSDIPTLIYKGLMSLWIFETLERQIFRSRRVLRTHRSWCGCVSVGPRKYMNFGFCWFELWAIQSDTPTIIYKCLMLLSFFGTLERQIFRSRRVLRTILDGLWAENL